MDSGASRHICNNVRLFQSIVNEISTKLILPNNETLMVNQSCTVVISNDIILEKCHVCS